MAGAAFSTGEAIRFGWKKTNENLRPLITLGVIAGVLTLMEQAFSRPRYGYGNNVGYWYPTAPFAALLVRGVEVAVTLVYVRLSLAAADGKPLELSKTRELLSGFWRFLLVSLVYGLIVAAGLILLIVPGLIWAAKYAFAPWLVADRGLSLSDSLRESGRLTVGVKGELWVFGLAALGINILGLLACAVGLLWSVPTSYIAAASIYRRLQERAGATPPPARTGQPAWSAP